MRQLPTIESLKQGCNARCATVRARAAERARSAGIALDRGSRKLSGRLSAVAFAGLIAMPLLPTLASKPARLSERTAVEIVSTRRLDLAGRPVATGPASGFTQAATAEATTGAPAHIDQSLSPADAPVRVARKEMRANADNGATAGKADKANASDADKPSKADTSSKAGQTGKAEKADDKPLPVPPASAPTEAQPETWSEAEIGEARKQCATLITGLPLEGDEAEPVRNGACGTPAPITLKKVGGAKVELAPAALVNCRMAVALNSWIDDVLQPAAREAFGQSVTRILTASSYVCRNRYGGATTPISEHAFANALDISGFVLGDGRVIKVLDGWGTTERDAVAQAEAAAAAALAASATKAADAKPEPNKSAVKKADGKAADAKSADSEAKSAASKTAPKSAKPGIIKSAAAATPDRNSGGDGGKSGAFLRKLHAGACTTFGTVLGPEANDAHRDHLHFDMKQRRAAHICD